MSAKDRTPGSGNVFADLGLPKPDDLLAKAELAAKIIEHGRLSGFSIERLMRFLLLLGRDIEISVRGRSKSGTPARLRVA